MEVKDRILSAAKELFRRYGIRSITMDDVCKELSISKKTLYQYFRDKDELVEEATKAHLERERNEFEVINERSENEIEELFMVSKCLRRNMNEVNPTLLYDLKRYYPNSWKHWLAFKDDYIAISIAENISRGMEAGWYRRDIDPKIMSILRIIEVELLYNMDVFPSTEFDYKKVQVQLFDHYVFGIATEKGRKLYQEYLESEKNEATI